MQSNENIVTNTKSFPQIWATLSKSEQDDLSIKFYQRKCCKTRQTVWNWGKGIYRPAPLVQDAVAGIVSNYLGEKCYAKTLFPDA